MTRRSTVPTRRWRATTTALSTRPGPESRRTSHGSKDPCPMYVTRSGVDASGRANKPCNSAPSNGAWRSPVFATTAPWRAPARCRCSRPWRRGALAAPPAGLRARRLVAPQSRHRLPCQGGKGPLLGALAIHRSSLRGERKRPHRRVLRRRRLSQDLAARRQGQADGLLRLSSGEDRLFHAHAGVVPPPRAELGIFVEEIVATLLSDNALYVNADRKGERAPVENGSTLSLKLLGDLSLVHRLAA